MLPRQTPPLGWFRETVRHQAFSQRPEQLPKVVQKELKTCVFLLPSFPTACVQLPSMCVLEEPGLCGRVSKRRAALVLPEGALAVCPV